MKKPAAVMAMVMLCAGGVAQAQDYPTKPVKIVVSYVPGGAPDMVARLLGQHLGNQFGQSFVVENKPGVGGTLGAVQVAKSPPDGYALLIGDSSQLVISPAILKEMPYNPSKAFAPISLVASTPLILVSNAKTTRIKTLQDLVREAKSSPGKLSYGSAGIGTMHHLAMEVFIADAGMVLTHIPYKGGGQSLPALLSGEIPVLVTSFTAVGPHIRSGAVNLLGVSTATRYPGAPDAPSLSEVVKGYHFSSEMGILAPIGTPAAVINKLATGLKTAIDSPEVLEKFKSSGLVPNWSTPEAYAENIQQNQAKFQRAVKIAKIQPQ